MRIIKFRGKRLGNGEWVVGDLIQPRDATGEIMCSILVINKVQECADSCMYHYYPVDPATVGQFTGLIDKNGKEIYEGDIICTKLDSEIVSNGDIQFDCGVFGVEWTRSKENRTLVGSWGQTHNLRTLDDEIINRIEVIGNIHDNPELLK